MSRIVVSLNWRCLWRLLRHGNEIVTLPDGSEIEFQYVRGVPKAIWGKVIRSEPNGKGCYVQLEESQQCSKP